ncbi:MAG: GNAT family N-acetyltransferase [Candidatus Coatesbacteria bacterium]|nr:GNAT family N-acetyltransferase [Candidatus Coatesbacteria bacterium]
MEIEIREACPADIPEILKLYSQLDLGGSRKAGNDEAYEKFRIINSYPFYKIYVALLDGMIAGTYSLLIMDSFAHGCQSPAVIENVVTEVNLRGKGIGRKMMEHAMEICKNMGCFKIILSSNVKRDKAHDFYESLGFRKHGYGFLVEL